MFTGEDNIEMNFQEIGCRRDRNKWQAPADEVMNI
jgi:hypothetical protein